jgi:hypothetical protein
MAPLAEKVRSHYVDNERISQDIQSMGYNRVAAVLEARLPQTARARSGDFGEIIATELAEEELGYDVPIRRLRYKDGRELALRGDDVIGFKVTPKQKLSILKGESKSRVDLSADVISKAREALSRNDGRPSAISLLFIADRLRDMGGPREQLGRKIIEEVADQAIPRSRIAHALFTVSGNPAKKAVADDLKAADRAFKHMSVHLRIQDHAAFIAEIFERALDLGND